MTVILRDGTHWRSVHVRYPDSATILRLYSEKAVAGYVLAGVPEVISFNLYAPWRKPLQKDDFSR